jgi:hypothetical protein
VQCLLLRYIRPVAAVVVGLLVVWLPFVSARTLATRLDARARARTPDRAPTVTVDVALA